MDDINNWIPNAAMMRRETLNCGGCLEIDIRVSSRVRAMNQSEPTVVPEAPIYRNSKVKILDFRPKIVRRLMFHSIMSDEKRSVRFVSNNEPENGLKYICLAKSLRSFTPVLSKKLVKSQDWRCIWRLVCPSLVGSVVVAHLADSLRLIEEGCS